VGSVVLGVHRRAVRNFRSVAAAHAAAWSGPGEPAPSTVAKLEEAGAPIFDSGISAGTTLATASLSCRGLAAALLAGPSSNGIVGAERASGALSGL